MHHLLMLYFAILIVSIPVDENSQTQLETSTESELPDFHEKMSRCEYDFVKGMLPRIDGLYTEDEDGFMVPRSR